MITDISPIKTDEKRQIFQRKKENCQCTVPYPDKLSFKSHSKIKILQTYKDERGLKILTEQNIKDTIQQEEK